MQPGDGWCKERPHTQSGGRQKQKVNTESPTSTRRPPSNARASRGHRFRNSLGIARRTMYLSANLLEELLDLLLNEVVNLVRKLLGLARESLGAVNDLARDDLDLVLDSGLNLLEL